MMHNLVLTIVGASTLWVGWFGFNAGSVVAANGAADMAMAVIQIAAAATALAWVFSEWVVVAQRTLHARRHPVARADG